MSSTAAPPKKEKLSRPAIKLVVLMGDATGAFPTADDDVDYLKPLRIEHAAGGGRVDVATLAYDLSKTGERIVDTLAPKGVNRQCEIRELDDKGEVKRVLSWGKLSAEPSVIDSGTESMTFIIRLDRNHFGEPVQQVPFWDNANEEVILIDRPLVFNPTIDDTVQRNRSDKTDSDRDDAFVFYDVGGPETLATRTTSGQTPSRWFLHQAVHCICWLLNQHETFIKNPKLAELFTALKEVDPDGKRLRNFTVPKGQFLNEVLDALLTPFGVGWYVDYQYDKPNLRSKRVLKFFVRNQGTPRELFLQRPGEQLVTSKSNTPLLSINYDVANLANKIIGQTSIKQREVTIELKKGWPVSEDGYSREDLKSNSDLQLAHPHAGRKWIANENGAWTDLRPEITEFLDLSDCFDGDPTLVTSRKCLPCLSRVSDEQTKALESRGVFAEWQNPESSSWEPVPWSYSKLEQEIGIWFETIPKQLWDLISSDPDTARIRVTCTIEGDCCTTKIAEKVDNSPNGDEIPLLLDLSDKFHDRKLIRSGPLASRFADSGTLADEQNDAVEMLAYLEKIRANEDCADLACSASLEGLDHPEWKISDLVTGVNGRNLKLNRNNPAAGVTPKYLQVLGITMDVQAQRMELNLESFDQEQL